MIEFRKVTKTYPSGITPFSGVDLTIRDGEVVSIIGPSGTGKSTMLRCINLLDAPTSGDIFIDGECITAPDCDVTQVRKKVGMVFQSFNLFEHLTVLENIMQPPMQKLGKSRQDAYDKAVELLKQMGLLDWQFYYPDQLSGGQKQRVAIARALAMEPKIMLFDEPTSALDPTMVGEVQMIIRKLTQSGMTMLVVSHDMDFCRDISSRVLYLDEGGVYEDGTPEQIFDHPLREKTRAFTHQLKTLTLRIDSPHYDFAAAVMKISEYCKDRRLSLAASNRVHRCYEELANAILIPELGADVHIRAELACSEADGSVSLSFLYNGASFDPQQTDNALSLTMLQSSATSLTHRDITHAEGFTNELIAVVRGDG